MLQIFKKFQKLFMYFEKKIIFTDFMFKLENEILHQFVKDFLSTRVIQFLLPEKAQLILEPFNNPRVSFVTHLLANFL